MLWAESTLHPYAERQGIWPDWSAGLAQITVMLASSFGYGDGTQASWEVVKNAMFDRSISIDCGSRYYRWKLDEVKRITSNIGDDDWLIAGLVRYNGGPHPMEDWYLQKYGSNLQRYKDGLQWAKTILR